MKKTIVSIFAFCLYTITGIAQINVTVDQQHLGKTVQNNTDIVGNIFNFPNRIEDYYFDSSSNSMVVILRDLSNNGTFLKNKGYIAVYDLKNNRLRWDKKVNFVTTRVVRSGNNIALNSSNKTSFLETTSGKELWSAPINLFYTNSANKIGIAYKYIDIGYGVLKFAEGIDLENGKSMWRRNINAEYGWNEISKIDEKNVLITASGLHQVNLLNGKGWDYEITTGRDDYTAMIAQNIMGAALGIFSGAYMVSMRKDVITSLVSNIVQENNNVFIASRKEIAKLGNNGKALWKVELPKDKTSRSYLYPFTNDLLLLNTAAAFYNGKSIDYGTPFIARYDKETGNEKYFVALGDKKERIKSHFFNGDSSQIYVLTENKIAAHNLSEGKKINELLWDVKKKESLSFFVDNNAYIKVNDVFIKLIDHYKQNCFVYSKSKKVYVLDEDLKITEEIDAKGIYKVIWEKEGRKIIVNNEQAVLLDKDSNIIANLQSISNLAVYNNYIYSIDKNKLIEIDMNTL